MRRIEHVCFCHERTSPGAVDPPNVCGAVLLCRHNNLASHNRLSWNVSMLSLTIGKLFMSRNAINNFGYRFGSYQSRSWQERARRPSPRSRRRRRRPRPPPDCRCSRTRPADRSGVRTPLCTALCRVYRSRHWTTEMPRTEFVRRRSIAEDGLRVAQPQPR
jgi:hypothetical protein